MNCLKNLVKKVKQPHSLAKSNHEHQIKDKKYLQDLSDSVKGNIFLKSNNFLMYDEIDVSKIK